MQHLKVYRPLFIAGVLSFISLGLPFWSIPYSQVNLPQALFSLGLVIWVSSILVLRVRLQIPVRSYGPFMIAIFPAIVMVRVVWECLQDPTRHNLWPFEIIFALLAGALLLLPSAALARLLAYTQKKAQPHPH